MKFRISEHLRLFFATAVLLLAAVTGHAEETLTGIVLEVDPGGTSLSVHPERTARPIRIVLAGRPPEAGQPQFLPLCIVAGATVVAQGHFQDEARAVFVASRIRNGDRHNDPTGARRRLAACADLAWGRTGCASLSPGQPGS